MLRSFLTELQAEKHQEGNIKTGYGSFPYGVQGLGLRALKIGDPNRNSILLSSLSGPLKRYP